ncbi:RNA-directed DNA polymerase, eukaryota, reverse transcriptase zinc-binding domain protein [Tanacetum coccineum]
MAWIKWDLVLASKAYGGLGVGSLKSFNLALLQKWRWRFLTRPHTLWVSLIKYVHGEDGGLDSARCATHGTWANVVASIHALHARDIILNNTIRLKVGCGSRVRFWKDVWIGDNALNEQYNRLFRLDVNEDCYMADRWSVNGRYWHWCRPIEGGKTSGMLAAMMDDIQNVNLNSESDSWQWLLGKDGVFTVGETRKHIDNVMDSSIRWNKFLPRKINVFMWRLSLDRLPHRFNLSRCGFDIDSILCPICLKTAETKGHVFSTCEFAYDV